MSYRSGYLDEEEAGGRWQAWRPMAGIGAAIILIFGVAGSKSIHLPDTLPPLLAYAGAGALVCYALAYIFALRRAAIGWRIAAFIIIVLAALLVGTARVGMDMGETRRDLARIRDDSRAVLEGRTLAPISGTPDSPAAVVRKFFVTLQADRAAFDAEMDKAGIDALLDPAELRHSDAILDDCSVTDRLKTRVEEQRTRLDTNIAETRRALQATPASSKVRRDMLAGFDESMTRNAAENARRWDYSLRALGELNTMCRVLARRHWQLSASSIGFTSDRDMNEFNAAVDRYNAIYTEDRALEEKARERLRGSLDKMQGL